MVACYDVFYGNRYTFVWLLLRKLFRLYAIRVLNKEMSSLESSSDDVNIRIMLSY